MATKSLSLAKLPDILATPFLCCLPSSLQVTYGFNGVFVFEHTVEEFELKSTVSESLRTVVKNLPMEDLHEAVPLKVVKKIIRRHFFQHLMIDIFFAVGKIRQITNGHEHDDKTSGVVELDLLRRDLVHQVLWRHHTGETTRDLLGSST